ncbi:MAG: NADAR family protein [Bacteroidales bacterium]|nr:NADAR family protein [Bacteroidales bacterium]
MKKYSQREYKRIDCCCFSSTKKEFGELSNMSAGFVLEVNGLKILTSEALYQAMRFTSFPDIQMKIFQEKSPMSAKMISKKYLQKTRVDWEEVKVDIMRWCLKVKLAQNFIKFGTLLETTYPKEIVELSTKDKFWGARPIEKSNLLIGINALGRLLMELRYEYFSENKYGLLKALPLEIDNFKLLDENIGIIDARDTFIQKIKEL